MWPTTYQLSDYVVVSGVLEGLYFIFSRDLHGPYISEFARQDIQMMSSARSEPQVLCDLYLYPNAYHPYHA